MPLRKRIGLFFLRLSTILLGAGVILILPEPNADSVLHFKNVVAVFLVVILIGKLLLDTFFFDRYS